MNFITFRCGKFAKMLSARPSDIFRQNFILWKIFAIWPGRNKNSFYRYYSWFYLSITLFLYNTLLFLNIYYTPRTIELLITQITYCFTEIAITTKVLTIVTEYDQIIDIFNLLDGDELGADDEMSESIIQKTDTIYNTAYRIYNYLNNASFTLQVFMPLFIYLLFGTPDEFELPIFKYYFLSDDVRDKYFWFWFWYQTIGMYGHAMYNVSVDSFLAGTMYIAVNQIKIIECKLVDLQLGTSENKLSFDTQDQMQMKKLNKVLRRFDYLLTYCSRIQNILGLAMFVQFAMSSVNICVSLCGLFLCSSVRAFIGLLMYLMAITLQIFVPSYLGTHLTHASNKLVFAAYNTEWIPRSESFKRSIKVFVTRVNIPIQMTGLSLFPLTLSTFTSIMKSAYSFFTLIRSFQE